MFYHIVDAHQQQVMGATAVAHVMAVDDVVTQLLQRVVLFLAEMIQHMQFDACVK